ncbi:hypothetical protein JNUCC0626_33680 [Lentzea sp. JNUCC 0626]|uniref:hypothetical protein n=1 Tax=Lentzea sp. JNUCC 0626 TaxID=3367513 RepID=UPI003749A576
MRKRFFAAVLGGLALLTMSTAPVQAAPPITGEVSAAAAECWTTFDPVAPQGGEMWQAYTNCNTAAITVGTAYVDASGQISALVTSCAKVLPGQTRTWYHPTTVPGVNYETVICDQSPRIAQPISVSTDQCWTSFFPSNPNGAPMLQAYKNCNNQSVNVTTGRSNASGQIVVSDNSCAAASPSGGVRWNHGSTAAGWNYHTVLCRFSA